MTRARSGGRDRPKAAPPPKQTAASSAETARAKWVMARREVSPLTSTASTPLVMTAVVCFVTARRCLAKYLSNTRQLPCEEHGQLSSERRWCASFNIVSITTFEKCAYVSRLLRVDASPSLSATARHGLAACTGAFGQLLIKVSLVCRTLNIESGATVPWASDERLDRSPERASR
eukprot:1982743-Pleurochrysis_carterae.AAC.1